MMNSAVLKNYDNLIYMIITCIAFPWKGLCVCKVPKVIVPLKNYRVLSDINDLHLILKKSEK